MKVGLVLSGGGIRGVSHLGVLKALQASNIKFCKITGTSAGSIVGALFAEGHDPYDILQNFLKMRLFKYLRPSFGGMSGMLSLENTAPLFKEYIPHNSFINLKIPLIITATNFSRNRLEYFSEGKLIPAIQASSAIPGVFTPVMMNGDMYVDGGVMNNFPVEAVEGDCDFILGVACNHLLEINKIKGIRHYLARTATMSISADMEEKRGRCHAMIEPRGIGEIGVLDIGRAEEIYWLAYETTLKALKTDPKLIELQEKIGKGLLKDVKN